MKQIKVLALGVAGVAYAAHGGENVMADKAAASCCSMKDCCEGGSCKVQGECCGCRKGGECQMGGACCSSSKR